MFKSVKSFLMVLVGVSFSAAVFAGQFFLVHEGDYTCELTSEASENFEAVKSIHLNIDDQYGFSYMNADENAIDENTVYNVTPSLKANMEILESHAVGDNSVSFSAFVDMNSAESSKISDNSYESSFETTAKIKDKNTSLKATGSMVVTVAVPAYRGVIQLEIKDSITFTDLSSGGTRTESVDLIYLCQKDSADTE